MQPRDQLIKFFRALDGLLSQKFQLKLIGGTAMVLGFGSARMTTDCDPWGTAEEEILDKWKQARQASGVDIYIDTQAGVAQLPDGAEDRFQELQDGFNNLTILYPEKHDLALSKISRLQGFDLDDVVWLHQNYGLEFEVLVSRYKDEFRPIYIGNKKFLDFNFLDTVEEIFGVEKRKVCENLLY